jgi:alkyl hydroperoxide reductase subunit D
MASLADIRAELPDAAVDLKLNLEAVLGASSLTVEQKWMIAVASALTTRHARLGEAVLAGARAEVGAPVVEDAIAAASLMAMNNVFYRFRHMIGKPSYGDRPARLRMNRLGRPATSKLDFELACLAVSAINGCEACVRAHEKVVLDGGLGEEQVNDAVRIAAVIAGVAVAHDGRTTVERSS